MQFFTFHFSLFTSFILLAVGCAAPPPPVPHFEAQTLDANVAIGYGLSIGDVDGDGRPDILLADKKQYVWYRNPGWQRFVLVDSLTARDNVALAARDIDGDGKVEVAVGAMWNPGETSDASQSGSVHYLARPTDPTQPWTPIQLPHEPTVHRMYWVRIGDAFHLLVAPLHGRGNQAGEGAGVLQIAYTRPTDSTQPWPSTVVDDAMHMTHNVEAVEAGGITDLYIAGKEGVRVATFQNGGWSAGAAPVPGMTYAAGEVRKGQFPNTPFLATIEPMHGTTVAVTFQEDPPRRIVLDSTFAEGHALAAADLLGIGRDQVVAGWRNPNAEGKVGIRLYVPDENGALWTMHVVDDNAMATEDLKVADLDGDGDLDIIAAGRATNNLVVYWNRTGD
ncbi:MAG: VCBS repeat-containing protein [Rhodothermales bacterium]|nr:VCBS repeat-containing protein [Rhodothermales bacterium]